MTPRERRRRDNRTIHWTTAVLRGLALLSLFLLPSSFRAGADAQHGHSLAQLWVDAADGHLDHHHPASQLNAADMLSNWLDPRVDLASPDAESAPAQGQPDVGEHEDSTPAPGGVHLLLAVAAFIPPIVARFVPGFSAARPPTGCSPRVLYPPPRLVSAGV